LPDIEQRLWKKYKNQGLVLAAIDPASEDYTRIPEVANFASTLGVTFPVGVEESNTYSLLTASFAGTNPYPVDILVDKRGIIRYVAREYDPVAIDAMLQQLLAE